MAKDASIRIYFKAVPQPVKRKATDDTIHDNITVAGRVSRPQLPLVAPNDKTASSPISTDRTREREPQGSTANCKDQGRQNSPTKRLLHRATAGATRVRGSDDGSSSPLSSCRSSSMERLAKSTPRTSRPLRHTRTSDKKDESCPDDGCALHSSSRRPDSTSILEESAPGRPPQPSSTAYKQGQNYAPNMSFMSSTSTLSSVPPSSQSSSRRIVKNGRPVVTNSSSDLDPIDELSETSSQRTVRNSTVTAPKDTTILFGSETEFDSLSDSSPDADAKARVLTSKSSARLPDSDDDSDFLDDVDDLLAKKKQKLTPHLSKTLARDTFDQTTGSNLRRSTRKTERPAPRQRSLSPPRKIYKNSLAALVAQKRRDEALEARILNMEASISRGDVTESADTQTGKAGLKPEAIAIIDEDEDGQKLKQVMKRMDALQTEIKFYFFEGGLEEKSSRPLFPAGCLSARGWTDMLRDETSRVQTITCGFAADMAQMSALPDEVQEWILGEILFETRQDLSHAYIKVLETCASHETTSSLLDLITLRDCVHRLGGRADFIEDIESVDPSVVQSRGGSPADASFHGVQHFALLLQKLSDKLSLPVLQASIQFLSIMLLDDKIRENVAATRALRSAIVSLVESPSNADFDVIKQHVMSKTLARVNNPVLLKRLLIGIPSTTARLYLMKRQLALAFFLDNPKLGATSLSSTTTWTAVTTQLSTNRTFAINDSTDYILLDAHIAILDIATGAGFSALDILRPHPTLTGSPNPLAIAVTPGPKASATPEEAAHNRSIDRLVSLLRQMGSNIRDSGAAHMRRTECKGCIDRLAVRLEFGGRTRLRPKKGIFGSENVLNGSAAGARGVLEGFVKRKLERMNEAQGEERD